MCFYAALVRRCMESRLSCNKNATILHVKLNIRSVQQTSTRSTNVIKYFFGANDIIKYIKRYYLILHFERHVSSRYDRTTIDYFQNRIVAVVDPRNSRLCRSNSSSNDSSNNNYVTNNDNSSNNGRSRGSRSRLRVRRRRSRRSPRGSWNSGSNPGRIIMRTSTVPRRRSRTIGSNECTEDNLRRSVKCNAIAMASAGI